MHYQRVLLKLSGEALQGEGGHGIDENRLLDYVHEVKQAAQTGTQMGIVIGGGNIFRGLSGVEKGFDRVKGDYMGMMATIINGMALLSAFESIGQPARLLTAFRTEPVGEAYSREKVEEAFEKNQVVIFAGGTGNPFFTTDTASALRAIEMKADVLLKGTRVDGVYNEDPEKNPQAVRYTSLTFDEAYQKHLRIMDLTAFTLCQENALPIVVFDMNSKGNLVKLVSGQQVGTVIHN